MTAGSSHGSDAVDNPRKRIERIRSAESLADLVRITDADDEHRAYVEAKRDWAAGMAQLPSTIGDAGGLPGTRVVVDGTEFWIHGVTHAGTDAEREFLREHVTRFLEAGERVYCEQGIRPMYFADFPDVCEMDDYRWAMAECKRRDLDSHVDEFPEVGIDGVLEDLTEVASQFREATFSLVDAGSDVYGNTLASAIGDLASVFFTTHEAMAIREEFEAFARSRRAAQNPARLSDLQEYYARSFLPQPLEREWLRRHDPELEVVTHARNERMA
ncbi:MAG: hypothetical protein V5A33_02800, partial [Halobacteriales archaeon]